ncbi:MAG: two-component sensor histidine kinase, partial [Actinomyces massiliensis]
MKVLTDKGVLLGACVLSALAGGAVSAAVVVWLLLAVAVGGLCAVVEHRREAIAAPACYLVLGCFTTASLVGAPLVVYDLTRAAALGPRWARLVA